MSIHTYETKPHGIMFHHFHDEKHAAVQGSISAKQFSQMIRYLNRDRILPAKEWMDRALESRLRKGDLCFTFDDTLRCQYDIAYPIMKELGITAFWFIYTSVMQGDLGRLEIYRYFRSTQFASIEHFYTHFFALLKRSEYREEAETALARFDVTSHLKNFTFYTDNDRKFRFLRDQVLGIDRYNRIMDQMIDVSDFDVSRAVQRLWLDERCLKTLRDDGHLIGLHSHSHPTHLSSMNKVAQENEFRSNRDFLRNLLGPQGVGFTMAHPCNSYNAETLEILRALGVRMGFRSNMVTDPNFGEFEFAREDHANVLKQMILHSL